MRHTILTAALLILPLAPAWAQDDDEGETGKRDLIVTLGAGAQAYPRWPGSDDLKIAPMPVFNWRKEGDPIPFEAPDEGIGFSLIGKEGGLEIGPAIQLQGKRKEKHVGAAVGNVGFTIEAGAFVQIQASRNLRFRAEARRGIGGHEAWTGDLGVDLVARGKQTVASIGPRLRLSNGKYQRAYFGVTPAVSAATGLAAYRPGGGLRAVGLVAGVTHQFSDAFGIYSYAGYDRLVGDAADSPIVRTFGSRGQPSVGLGLTYSFKVRR